MFCPARRLESWRLELWTYLVLDSGFGSWAWLHDLTWPGMVWLKMAFITKLVWMTACLDVEDNDQRYELWFLGYKGDNRDRRHGHRLEARWLYTTERSLVLASVFTWYGALGYFRVYGFSCQWTEFCENYPANAVVLVDARPLLILSCVFTCLDIMMGCRYISLYICQRWDAVSVQGFHKP